MSQQDTVVIQLLGKKYQIACQPDEASGLRQAADLLQQRMQAIEASGKVTGSDRIALMAALNLAHDLLQAQAMPSADARIHALQTQITNTLVGAHGHAPLPLSGTTENGCSTPL
ncbi:MAG: cell division protein ZapA [Pseudomonadota bacterium]